MSRTNNPLTESSTERDEILTASSNSQQIYTWMDARQHSTWQAVPNSCWKTPTAAQQVAGCAARHPHPRTAAAVHGGAPCLPAGHPPGRHQVHQGPRLQDLQPQESAQCIHDTCSQEYVATETSTPATEVSTMYTQYMQPEICCHRKQHTSYRSQHIVYTTHPAGNILISIQNPYTHKLNTLLHDTCHT